MRNGRFEYLVAACWLLSGNPVFGLADGNRPGTANSVPLNTWRVDVGTVVIEFDADALGGTSLAAIRAEGGQATEGRLFFEVEADGSDARITTRDGQPFSFVGYMQTRGRYLAPSSARPGGSPVGVGDFLVSFDGRGGRLTDRLGVQRDVMELDPDSITLAIGEGGKTLSVTAMLRLAESFADEVLGRAELAGRPVGAVAMELAVSLMDADVSAEVDRDDPRSADPRGGTSNGPDVIVSSVAGPFTLYGTVGDVAGYSLTTVSCNLGEADAIWIDCTNGDPDCNQHPVIGQTFYRLKGGRFEQLGMNWLKHGFCAADAPSCGSPYEPNISCDWLGTHATDTYSADLNGQQNRLGPRSEINPWTGEYPYPYVMAWQQTGDAIYKRLQIKTDDIDPAQNAGALYYAEVQYICTDEQEVNRYNNVSWRRATVGSPVGDSWDLSLSGSTTSQQACINAWKVNDAAVTLVNIDVPSDGRFILGYKVTDLLDGTWNYEYALYNMNSDRAAQAFIVPMPERSVLSGAGFHDVDYHSGEPYSLTDWAATRTAASHAWQTDLIGDDANANALRWSSTYNFRFNADSPPTAGDIEIALFKSGSPASVMVSAQVPSAPVCACGADLDHNTVVDAGDVRPFVNMYLGEAQISICSDLATPFTGPLDTDDLNAFVAAVLAGPTCP